jgi:hypothetical protein
VAIATFRNESNGRRIADGIRFDPGAEPPPVEPDVETRLSGAMPSIVPNLGAAPGGSSAAFLSRCVVVQAIGLACVAALWVAGLAGLPFEGANGPLCWIIVGIGAVGIACVFLQRWRDVQWIATHVVRIGLLGTVVGLIIAFAAARDGGSADAEAVKSMIASVVDGMYVSLYATLLGIAVNLWLKINLRLLGNVHG